MTGTIVQINVSPGGLPKRPVPEAHITRLGVEGDGHEHPQIHGGPERALLLVCAETVDELIARGYPLFYGALGENLTVRGLDRRRLRAGQRYRAGQAVIELTRLRAPCSSLDIYGPELRREIFDPAVKAVDARSPVWGMSGFYAAVISPGLVRTDDIISLLEEAA